MSTPEDLPPVPSDRPGQEIVYRQVQNRAHELSRAKDDAEKSVSSLGTALRRAATAGNAGGLLAALSVMGPTISDSVTGDFRQGPRELFALVCLFSSGLLLSAVSTLFERLSSSIISLKLVSFDHFWARIVMWKSGDGQELARLVKFLREIDVDTKTQAKSNSAANLAWYVTLVSLAIVVVGWAVGLWLVSEFTEWKIWFVEPNTTQT